MPLKWGIVFLLPSPAGLLFPQRVIFIPSVQPSQPKHKVALQIWDLLSVNDYQRSPTTWPLNEKEFLQPQQDCFLLLLPEINIHFHIFILLPDLFNPGPGGVKTTFLSDGWVVQWRRWTSLPLLWGSSSLKSGCPSLVVFNLEGVLVQWHLSPLLAFNLECSRSQGTKKLCWKAVELMVSCWSVWSPVCIYGNSWMAEFVKGLVPCGGVFWDF